MEISNRVNMQELQGIYEDIVDVQEFIHMVVVVKTPAAPALEVIINPRENFEGKIKYYMNAYDNEGRLKNNPDVKIIGFAFTQKWEATQTYVQSLM